MSDNGIIRVTLPDGSELEVPAGFTPADVAARIGPGLARDALVAEVAGQPWDLGRALERDARLRILTERDPKALEVYRHSTAHLMAQAVQRLYPGTMVT
ncbi:MAG: TGS domain-containing protein, partial [Candidatus Rokuibacteriota bacterium]